MGTQATIRDRAPAPVSRTGAGGDGVSPVGSDEAARRAAERLMDAMLHASGKQGFSAVDPNILYAPEDRVLFEHLFQTKEGCLARAYGAKAEELERRLSRHRAEGLNGATLLETGLLALGDFIATRPMAARAVLSEARAAGRSARAERLRVMHSLALRLDEAFDGATPRPLTAYFLVSTIESTAATCCLGLDPGEFLATVPELLEMVAAAFATPPGG